MYIYYFQAYLTVIFTGHPHQYSIKNFVFSFSVAGLRGLEYNVIILPFFL